MNRRQFVKAGSAGIIYLMSICLSCKEKKPSADSPATSDPCTDLTGLTEMDLQIRKSLSYVAESPYEDQLCDNCKFWIDGKEGAACGGCVSIRGPIHPKGYCSYWAPPL